MMALRQQMDHSNHDMVNLLSTQMHNIMTPLYELINKIGDKLGEGPPSRAMSANLNEMDNPDGNGIFRQNIGQPNRNPNDNIDQIVERILNRHGFDVGRNERPYFVSAFPDYVTQVELQRRTKVPKFSKFAGELTESTVEHIARYVVECGDLANNEYLKMKYFPSSLTKHAFTWFSTLPPNSIHTWIRLEGSFHEHFFREETKVSIVDLMNIKRQNHETLDDYLNRFRQLKSRCYTNIPEHELVRIAATGLDFSIRKKLVNEQLRDMAQLAEKVRRIEQIKLEKERLGKFDKFVRKEKVAYLENFEFSDDPNYEISSEDFEINLAELRPGPTYQCQMLKPGDSVEGNSTKRYSFDVCKAEKIFDILLKDKQIVLPENHKIPPFEQRKGKKFCKYHNMYSHWTNNCVHFRDMIERAITDGRLAFEEKDMKVDVDPFAAHTGYVELVSMPINMADVNVKDDENIEPISDEWNEEHQKAFEEIKVYLAHPPVLAPLSKGKQLKLYIQLAIRLLRKYELGTGIGLLIISPEGIPTKLSFETDRRYSNNETEYQAIITGLEILIELGAKNVIIRGDSQLVIKQLTEEYKCLNEKLIELKSRAVQLLNAFDEVELQHIPRDSNTIANELAQMASGYKVKKVHTEKELISHRKILSVGSSSQQDWRSKLVEYLQNSNLKVERKIKLQALNYVLLNNELYKRGFDGVLFKCLGNHETYIAMAEVHEGICGAHQAGEKMKWTLSRKGLYWPTMIKDCIEFAKSCEECQRHGPIQRVPASELHSIIKPWPFRGWEIDIIGQIHPPSSKNHKYILVAIDYFTKWVEAIPLKEVEQKDIIDFVEDHIITRFGIPQTITTNQGTIFTGRKVARYAESRGIKLITSTPYYAQTNGQVDAVNKLIISLIKRHISGKPRNWHETLVQILWAYRNSPRDATKTTPYKLVYGHDAVLPLDINLQSIHVQKQNDLPIEDYWNLMYDELISLDEERLIALQSLVQQKERVKKSYNKKVKTQRFRVGDLVLKVILPMDQKSRYLGKWSYNWEGPFIIEQVYSKNAYVIKEIKSNVSKVINGKYLKCLHKRIE
uniref:Pro-Pol polyprotein n=1 Tax=Cajanus cajan TaxID=3821 RepID=A0A151R8P5_CAJCA|nr:Pro-Pol polyprotein [Cajanus cajan]